jgi:hypothetical protein
MEHQQVGIRLFEDGITLQAAPSSGNDPTGDKCVTEIAPWLDESLQIRID